MAKAKAPDSGVSGWLVVDKPLGLSSFQVVAKVRRALGTRRVGHGGTLDPLASGILPIAVGEATKTVSYAMDGRKTYRFAVAWGTSRNTDDAEGEATGESPVRPDAAAIRAALPAFVGEISQVPPAFSAIKVGGERSYKLARAGAAVELAARMVTVTRLELLEALPDMARFEVDCGKGLYVRSLGRDLAKALGTLGYIAELRRTRVGPFDEKTAISLAKLEALGHSAAAFETLLPIETVLDDIPALALTDADAARLRQGQPVQALGTGSPASRLPEDGAIALATANGKPVALARFERGMLRPVRVLNL
ncbi:MAG: tRNA pseudouridine(55) synthase TruB [Alphaproteobacteria bacterium]